MNTLSEGIWKSSKSHLRKQEKMMEQYGVEGAVRETLLASQHRRQHNNNTNSISFHEQIRQRPLDRTILEDIYKNLHGRRIERKLKKGVSYEHWITKGDGTAPVFTASLKAKQTFAFGGEVKLIKKCTHPSEFPVFPRPGISKNENRNKKLTPKDLYMPEVAFIGRTSSGKSSLLNSILNLQVAPYGHLQGTTTAAHFYAVGGKERGITLVDLPGYGFYHPMSAAAVDAGNAVATMRAYLHSASEVKFKPRGDNKNKNQNNNKIDGKESSYTDAFLHLENPLTVKDPYPSSSRGNHKNNNHHKGVSVQRNVARVFLCCSARGLQELDYQYCELLNELHIPFAVVFTKTDAAPIRFLARLCDYTRERLVAFPYCEELLLTSALRLSGIEQIQNIIGSMSTEREATTVAEDFSAIV
ncbi:hypothetical protein AGDE_07969 [Angomonas deanei]|nr:hypothetical protein AGDE_07969 [Angomonas deanei]|eukprot:EPY34123.1 hypothetical protein AGDE_07969 [Angomonas deanei]